jgi:ethanolamine utilization protein EutN
MVVGEVVGRLWASRQAATLAGRKMLLVRPMGARGAGRGLVVAQDGLDAGPGDRVIVARGSRVRDVTIGETAPDKDVVTGVVDDWQETAEAPAGRGAVWSVRVGVK